MVPVLDAETFSEWRGGSSYPKIVGVSFFCAFGVNLFVHVDQTMRLFRRLALPPVFLLDAETFSEWRGGSL